MKEQLKIRLDLSREKKKIIERTIENLKKESQKFEPVKEENISFKYIYSKEELENTRRKINTRANETYEERHPKRKLLGRNK